MYVFIKSKTPQPDTDDESEDLTHLALSSAPSVHEENVFIDHDNDDDEDDVDDDEQGPAAL